jgi:hypothetical protein
VARQSTASFVAIEEVASWEMQKNPNTSMLYLITRNYFDGILLNGAHLFQNQIFLDIIDKKSFFCQITTKIFQFKSEKCITTILH